MHIQNTCNEEPMALLTAKRFIQNFSVVLILHGTKWAGSPESTVHTVLLLLGIRVCKTGPDIVFHCRIEICRNLRLIRTRRHSSFVHIKLHVIPSSFFSV
ncbi:hypothetical protein MtrunA17_Chr8g0338151 [Medicago truncatula]|uniref:Uncharacterized protein n=1 Tax=Medicago truncatula TaxID=3880 RepID=A0A396GJQ9_MEDTR|nr:hypothetical protein MtrunA17_Chr8g0338151 [Medicago truncatula]